MEIDIIRLERQQQGIERWFSSSNFGASKDKEGTLNYCTGVGKTFTAILIIKRLFKTIPLHHVIVVVPSDALAFQWRLKLSENFTKAELNRIEVFTASFVINSNIKISTDTLIVDELHAFLGEEFIKVIDGTHIKSDNRLGLTATYTDPKGRHSLYETLFPVIDTISEAEAIDKGWIAAYVEYNLAVSFTDKEAEFYEAFTEVISKHLNKFGRGGIDLATKCLAGGKHNGKHYDAKGFVFAWATKKGWSKNLDMSNPTDIQINDLWHPGKIIGYASTLMNSIRKRKDLLYNSYNKALITVEIIEKFLGEKTIVFGQKTIYADKVNNLLNEKYPGYSVAYHSNVATQMRPSPVTGKLIKYGKGRLKKEAVEAIKNGRARAICTASSLDTGFDVNDILLAIIGSGTQNFNQHKQRGGRVKRIADVLAKDKRKLIVNLYLPGTKDESWLRKRQSESKNDIHWITSVDEIVYNPVHKSEFNINTI